MSDLSYTEDMVEVDIRRDRDGALVDHFCSDGLEPTVWRINRNLDWADEVLTYSVVPLYGTGGNVALAERVRAEVRAALLVTAFDTSNDAAKVLGLTPTAAEV